MFKAHLPHLTTRLAFVSVEEQAPVVNGPETSSRVGRGVGRCVVHVVIGDVSDHPRRTVRRIVRPQLTARAVRGGVKVHHTADAHHHVLAGVAAIGARDKVGSTVRVAGFCVVDPQLLSTCNVLGLEEGQVTNHGFVRSLPGIGAEVLHHTPGGAVGNVVSPQTIVSRVKEQGITHKERHVLAGIAVRLAQF